MTNSNIKNQNTYLGYLPTKRTICAVGLLSTVLFCHSAALSKELGEKTEDPKTTTEQQSVNNSKDTYFEDYKRQVNQLFQELDRFHSRPFLKNWDNLDDILTNSNRIYTNIAAYDKQYILNIDCPGFDKKELKIETHGDYLIINGKKTIENEDDKEKSFFNQEYRNSFQHRLLMPKDVNTNSITSNLKNGVLTIVLPRAEDKKLEPKQILIN